MQNIGNLYVCAKCSHKKRGGFSTQSALTLIKYYHSYTKVRRFGVNARAFCVNASVLGEREHSVQNRAHFV